MRKNIGFMLDIESIDTGPRAVVLQIGVIGFDLDDPDTVLLEMQEPLPIQPQIALGRTISARTLIWWMGQDHEARAHFTQNGGEDMDELIAIVRDVNRKMDRLINNADTVEVWARGPQFDAVNLETLFNECGQSVAWSYSHVRDLRTLMGSAKISTADVPRDPKHVPHVAIHDCRYQLECYVEAMRRLEVRSIRSTPPSSGHFSLGSGAPTDPAGLTSGAAS